MAGQIPMKNEDQLYLSWKKYRGTTGRNWKEKEIWQYMLTIPLSLCSFGLPDQRFSKEGLKDQLLAKKPSIRGYGGLSLRELSIPGELTWVQCTSPAVVEGMKIGASIISKCFWTDKNSSLNMALVWGGHEVKEAESELHAYNMSSSIEFSELWMRPQEHSVWKNAVLSKKISILSFLFSSHLFLISEVFLFGFLRGFFEQKVLWWPACNLENKNYSWYAAF